MNKNDKKLLIISQANEVVNYTIKNLQTCFEVVLKLYSETNELINEYDELKSNKLSFKEKRDLRAKANKIKYNLNYLYLAKEFLIYVNKFISKLPMNDDDYIYIIKFLPFFDGIKVIEKEDELDNTFEIYFAEINLPYDEDLYDLFSFQDSLIEYEDEINNMVLPDFERVMKSLSKINGDFVTSSEDLLSCNNCGSKIDKSSKFCPECGLKIEENVNNHCKNCNAKIKSGSKFCSECGYKII